MTTTSLASNTLAIKIQGTNESNGPKISKRQDESHLQNDCNEVGRQTP